MLYGVLKSIGFVIAKCLIVIVMNVGCGSGVDGLCLYVLLIL